MPIRSSNYRGLYMDELHPLALQTGHGRVPSEPRAASPSERTPSPMKEPLHVLIGFTGPLYHFAGAGYRARLNGDYTQGLAAQILGLRQTRALECDGSIDRGTRVSIDGLDLGPSARAIISTSGPTSANVTFFAADPSRPGYRRHQRRRLPFPSISCSAEASKPRRVSNRDVSRRRRENQLLGVRWRPRQGGSAARLPSRVDRIRFSAF